MLYFFGIGIVNTLTTRHRVEKKKFEISTVKKSLALCHLKKPGLNFAFKFNKWCIFYIISTFYDVHRLQYIGKDLIHL